MGPSPRPLAQMHAAWDRGDIATATEINRRMFPLHRALFCETSPGPVKYAASLMGRCLPDTRLPLCEIAESTKTRVRDAMVSAGLIN